MLHTSTKYSQYTDWRIASFHFPIYSIWVYDMVAVRTLFCFFFELIRNLFGFSQCSTLSSSDAHTKFQTWRFVIAYSFNLSIYSKLHVGHMKLSSLDNNAKHQILCGKFILMKIAKLIFLLSDLSQFWSVTQSFSTHILNIDTLKIVHAIGRLLN